MDDRLTGMTDSEYARAEEDGFNENFLFDLGVEQCPYCEYLLYEEDIIDAKCPNCGSVFDASQY